jgi:hypothetical protein
MRRVKDIKIWMLRNDIKEADIVRATEVEQSYVNKTINGTRNNREVLRYLLEQGCPARYLALPKDMEEAA